MSAQTSMLHIRVNDELKSQATIALSGIGLSVSDAVRLFLCRVIAEQAIPFELKVPNSSTLEAMNEAEGIAKTRAARFTSSDEIFNDLENHSKK
ncbi:type II toxin-antitoxin system RelB/DinJ family antitoxin [Enterobacter ludwigii]|uniref:type II toxin-antitoxin system RelB/DinJ family antitoxin n=1 Tax=Enterobacter ludwigii TaxID=299767 RepID=UPI003BEF3A35